MRNEQKYLKLNSDGKLSLTTNFVWMVLLTSKVPWGYWVSDSQALTSGRALFCPKIKLALCCPKLSVKLSTLSLQDQQIS